MDNAVISSPEDINNFETLKAVADDIQARLDEINDQFGYDLKGAFTSAGMDGSSDWRFKTHLANLPIYYEYKDKGIDSTDAIEGTYLDNYKQIWDLYITDSTCEPGLLSSKTGDEAESEFGMEEAVFYQNGTWEYSNLTNEDNGYLVTATLVWTVRKIRDSAQVLRTTGALIIRHPQRISRQHLISLSG